MPRFSEYFDLGLSQKQLDFVDVSNEYDTPLYVDPYAIEIRNDIWAAKASDSIRIFFLEVLEALRIGDQGRAINLMSKLGEPSETFLGISQGRPKGRGVGSKQSSQLIQAIQSSEAFQSGFLSDLSEMALFVEGVGRDKISDLTTNVIRGLLAEYTLQQCDLYDLQVEDYNGPPVWEVDHKNWQNKTLQLPRIEGEPVLLVPKYIVRRKLCLDSQEFYNKQITDFFVSENLNAGSSLVQTIKGVNKVYKKDVRRENPKTKKLLSEMVCMHPELLTEYKKIADESSSLVQFNDDEPSVQAICRQLAAEFPRISPGREAADDYHRLVQGALMVLFYPSLIQPHKEWEIHGGRKRVDIVFTNAADTGFFAHRREQADVNAVAVTVECKNYSKDIANAELDQLLGRFDHNRGKFGFIACRSVKDSQRLAERLNAAAVRKQGYVIVLTDSDLIEMLEAKAALGEDQIEGMLHRKFSELLR